MDFYSDFPRGNSKFIKDSKRLYKDESFLYSLCNYKNDYTHIILICKHHGPFRTIPKNHLEGKTKCPSCSRKRTTWTRMKLLTYLKLKKYSSIKLLTKGDSFHLSDLLQLDCDKHGAYETTLKNLVLRKLPCIHCQKLFESVKTKGNERMNTEEFIIKAKLKYGDKYTYGDAIYTSSKDTIIITCPQHGNFPKVAAHFLNGNECPTCLIEKRRNDATEENIKFLQTAYPTFTFSYEGTCLFHSTAVSIVCPNGHAKVRSFKALHRGKHKCRICNL